LKVARLLSTSVIVRNPTPNDRGKVVVVGATVVVVTAGDVATAADVEGATEVLGPTVAFAEQAQIVAATSAKADNRAARRPEEILPPRLLT
jgi:hypothetical protein